MAEYEGKIIFLDGTLIVNRNTNIERIAKILDKDIAVLTDLSIKEREGFLHLLSTAGSVTVSNNYPTNYRETRYKGKTVIFK
jgi:hypothetical protein